MARAPGLCSQRARARARERPGGAELRQRVVALPGDLAEPGLGVGEAAAAALAAEVDAILHCAASIAFDAHGQALLATNYTVRWRPPR